MHDVGCDKRLNAAGQERREKERKKLARSAAQRLPASANGIARPGDPPNTSTLRVTQAVKAASYRADDTVA